MKNVLINSNVWIGLGAVGLVAVTDSLVGTSLNWHLYSLVFFATILTYNWQRLLSIRKRQELNILGNSEWLHANRLYIYISSVVAAAVCAYNFFHLNDWQQSALVILGSISVLYALPVFPNPKGWIRLRDFGITKPFVLGITWGLVTTLLPMASYADIECAGVTYVRHNELFIISRCLMMIGLCIPFDIKDMAFDRATMAYPTLPVKFGVKPTLVIASLFSIAGFTAFAFWWLHSGWGWPILLAAAISLVLELWLINRTKETSPDWYYSIVLDGVLVLHTLILLGTMGVWILFLLMTNAPLD